MGQRKVYIYEKKDNKQYSYFLLKLQENPNFNGYSFKLHVEYSQQTITCINWNVLVYLLLF